MQAKEPGYFAAYRSLKFTRDTQGVLVVEFHTKGGPLTFTAQDHTDFVDAFYRISQDRDNKIVILTGTGGEFIPGIDFSSFGNVADPGVWSQVHDEGVQILENLSNIRVLMIAAIEGRAYVHSEYALLTNVIVAGEGATFNDLPHFAGGIVPGDGIFATWSYRAGAGRAEAFLLNAQPVTAQTAYEWGVVAEVVRDGKALARARELAAIFLKAPEVTRRNTRAHFIQPLKERIVREVGYGLSLEGASAADLVKSMQAKADHAVRKKKWHEDARTHFSHPVSEEDQPYSDRLQGLWRRRGGDHDLRADCNERRVTLYRARDTILAHPSLVGGLIPLLSSVPSPPRSADAKADRGATRQSSQSAPAVHADPKSR